MTITTSMDKCISQSKSYDEAIAMFCKMNSTDSVKVTSNDISEDDKMKAFKKFSNFKGNGETASKLSEYAGKGVDLMKQLFTSQEVTSMDQVNSDLIKTESVLSLLQDKQGNFGNIKEILLNTISTAKDGFVQYEAQQSALLNELNKNVGLTGELSKNFREELTIANPELLKYGITFNELSKAAQSLVANTGRFLLLNKESFLELGKIGQAYTGSLQNLIEMLPGFEKIGMGAIMASDAIGKAGAESLSLGLNSQKVTKDLGENIGRLNEYGFQNGVQGLSKMVEKSIEFRSSMQSVYSVAEKVMNPEGALDLAANLQVLGGAIGEMGDPLKLTYMATNNMEGLQDAILQTAGSLASYNAQSGKFEINAVNMRRGRDMAREMGIEYKELAQSAIAFQERGMAKTQLLNLGITDDQKDFLTNLSHMEGGELKIDLQGTSFKNQFKDLVDKNGAVTLQQVADNSELRQKLIANQEELAKKSPEEIIKGQATNVQNIMRNVSFLAASVRMTGSQGVEKLAETMGLDMSGITDSIEKRIKAGELDVKNLDNTIKNWFDSQGKDKKYLEELKTKPATTATNANELKEQMSKEKTNTATTTNSTKTVEHKITFGGGPSEMTALRRELTKNQNLFSDFLDVEKKGEYTEN